MYSGHSLHIQNRNYARKHFEEDCSLVWYSVDEVPPNPPAVPMASMGMMGTRLKQRKEGDIGSVFASLSGESEQQLPERFLDLKRKIIGDEAQQAKLVDSWERLVGHLAKVSETIASKQQDCIPVTTYEDFVESKGSTIETIKSGGAVIVRNVVSEEQAEAWLKELREYIASNPSVRGFPQDDKQVFELYWSKPQLQARSHLRSLAVQKRLLELFKSSPSLPVSLLTPLSYADRLRIRNPGDARFSLGPHIDGGSVERWEDEGYRKVYQTILEGRWEDYDAWDMEHRVSANQNLYDGAGACGVLRAFQGWTSLSDTGPGEGTLKVYPLIKELSAYTLLRPLFRSKASKAEIGHEAFLDASNWQLDTGTSRFPGSPLGRCQELNEETHPHLQLDRTMVSIPHVRPGDQAWWHGDMIHAVESTHSGKGPSSVMYIPSVPLTPINVKYLRDQREHFLAARPPPDFPGGVGESQFQGTGKESDIVDLTGRRAMGLEPFSLEGDLTTGEIAVRKRANAELGFA